MPIPEDVKPGTLVRISVGVQASMGWAQTGVITGNAGYRGIDGRWIVTVKFNSDIDDKCEPWEWSMDIADLDLRT